MDQFSSCPECGSEIARGEAFCGECGKQVARARPPLRRRKGLRGIAYQYAKSVHAKKMRSGRIAILIVTILSFLGLLVILALPEIVIGKDVDKKMYAAVVVAQAVISCLFLAFWIWAKWNPFAASVSALVVYLTMHLATAAFDPTSILKGIIIKIIIVILLISAIKSSLAFRRLQRRIREREARPARRACGMHPEGSEDRTYRILEPES